MKSVVVLQGNTICIVCICIYRSSVMDANFFAVYALPLLYVPIPFGAYLHGNVNRPKE